MSNTVERTARTEFILRGERVRKGQIVTLNRIELEKYTGAECVYADERRNAEVPVDKMPEPAVDPAKVKSAADLAQPAPEPRFAPEPDAQAPAAPAAKPATKTSSTEKPRFK